MKRKKKLPTLPAMRNKLDALFSKWVRLSAADRDGYAMCVSCGVWSPWKEMDAGHFIPRGSTASRWDPRNCHPQCRRCNRFAVDHYIGYTLWMQEHYGQSVIDELRRLKNLPFAMRRAEYEQKIGQVSGWLAKLADGHVRESKGTRWALDHCS